MRIGITGWKGFIGSYLRDRIESPILFQGDMCRFEDVKVFVKDCDRIYHVAGKNREAEGDILANNLVSTGNLVLSLRSRGLDAEIIFVSSKQVEWNPYSEYGLTKNLEEDIIKRMNRWCIFRVPNVYGAGGKPYYNSVVTTFAYMLSHHRKVTIDNPSDTREFVFAEDLIDELLKPIFCEYINIEGEIMSVGGIYEYLTTKLGEHGNLKKCLDYWGKNVSTS